MKLPLSEIALEADLPPVHPCVANDIRKKMKKIINKICLPIESVR